ncbi:aconitase [Candidatus Koribacter versatilis Ellin345]|uniref:Aconitate hydratase n=1 Tax=Koribacter versatilis (strain Ellin345) TaxID=204669 RepID=Q1IV71_KORVE|nr:aconitate hydratase AcnA [Candidatus Koribacter versatilis]ABF39229.1 aconitase [Candidatus Koribacter versatilis Ellin345]
MNSFDSRAVLRVDGREYEIYRLDALDKQGFNVARLPFSLRILLENLLRREDGRNVKADEIRALAGWDPKAVPAQEIAFMPSRVLLQDFTGVPAVVDLAAMREAMKALGGDATKINPLQPAELVIDHSVQVDEFGSAKAFDLNAELEFIRNKERYAFLRWGQTAFKNFAIVPPDTGIVHQVNVEYLARVVFVAQQGSNGSSKAVAYPDTLVGTDSHTTMVNGLGVLGWGVGGIEAEAAMLGQPVSMLIPQVVGVRLTGKLPEGATATDLVLTLTEMLRRHGVVGKFVEYFGSGLRHLPLADRTTIANMAPEYGATCGIFPVDDETLRYLRLSGRSEEHIKLVEAYCKEQGLFHTHDTPEAEYSEVLDLHLATVEPSVAGPKRPQDRVVLGHVGESFEKALPTLVKPGTKLEDNFKHNATPKGGETVAEGVNHGAVVIAAITSCTNTSNPSVMIGAGLVAKKAVEKGLKTPAWVKTSLAPGSKVVTDYYIKSGLLTYLEQLGFNVVGYGCTTCIGNSGPLPEEVSKHVGEKDLVVASVLSGNRNFEGRINSEVRANYLMSPPLVVAFALAGRIDFDPTKDAIGIGNDGNEVFLKDIWPTSQEVDDVVNSCIEGSMFRKSYGDVFKGDQRWQGLNVPTGETFAWEDTSTYVKNPPYFEGMTLTPKAVEEIKGARVLAVLGHSITTDHISPAGSIKKDGPAGKYLTEHGVKIADFNSFGSRRGNHEVMMRGTFANTRLRNKMVPGTEGGYTKHLPSGEQMSIFDASEKYRAEGVPTVILAGKEYGSGSSRDWAAKGPRLLGVRAVIAESFERIHRSNLVGMGIIPLQFLEGEDVEKHGLTGDETIEIRGLNEALDNFAPGKTVEVLATHNNGKTETFRATLRIDTPQEVQYFRHGGILHYVVRQLAGAAKN